MEPVRRIRQVEKFEGGRARQWETWMEYPGAGRDSTNLSRRPWRLRPICEVVSLQRPRLRDVDENAPRRRQGDKNHLLLAGAPAARGPPGDVRPRANQSWVEPRLSRRRACSGIAKDESAPRNRLGIRPQHDGNARRCLECESLRAIGSPTVGLHAHVPQTRSMNGKDGDGDRLDRPLTRAG